MEDEILESSGEELEQGSSEEQTLEQPIESSDSEEQTQEKPYWQQHDNHKKGFWKTEQDVIKGYDYYDKKFKPIETVLKQRGIQDHDGLTNILSEYDKYTDPNSEINQTYNAIQALFNHPTYGQQFNDFVNNIVETAEVERYGTKLPYEVKQKLQEVEQLKQWKEQQEYQGQVQQYEQKLDSISSQIENFCKEKGIQLQEDDIKNHIIDCADKKVGIDYVFDRFITNKLDDILGNVQNKASKAVVSNIQNNAKGAVASGARVASNSEDIPTDSAGLKNALRNIFK